MSDGHYFASDPVKPSRPMVVPLVLPDVTLTLRTDRGVFSGASIDRGTKLLLLEGPAPPSAGHLLDLGCGYGPIALVLATRAPSATVWAIDVNGRARELAAANAAAAGITNVTVCPPEEVPAAIRFAAVYSNPPVRIGKAALQQTLTAWLTRLEPGGRAHLVVHKHLGADSLTSWMRDCGWAVIRQSSRMGYRLLTVTPTAARP